MVFCIRHHRPVRPSVGALDCIAGLNARLVITPTAEKPHAPPPAVGYPCRSIAVRADVPEPFVRAEIRVLGAPRALGGPPRACGGAAQGRAGRPHSPACGQGSDGRATACPGTGRLQGARPDLSGGRGICAATYMARGRRATQPRTSLAMPTKQGHHGEDFCTNAIAPSSAASLLGLDVLRVAVI